MERNPFKPSFGVLPPVLAGRDLILSSFAEALDDGPGSQARCSIFTGARGTGKTCLLSEAEGIAQQRGWLSISETATPGLLNRFTHTHLPHLLREHSSKRTERKLTGLSAPGIGSASWTRTDKYVVLDTFRSRLTELMMVLQPHETGLLITIDEVSNMVRDDLREIAATIQHAFREAQDVALLLAGLPSTVDALLNEDPLTFLRRAERQKLGSVSNAEIRRALQDPIQAAGRDIDIPALDVASNATSGYPFLIQLVGYHMWRHTPDSRIITAEDAQAGIEAASIRLAHAVFEPSLKEVSAKDRAFLRAMAHDEGPSRITDIATRIQSTSNTANRYRARLLAAQLIHATDRGFVDFTLPGLRAYLRDD